MHPEKWVAFRADRTEQVLVAFRANKTKFRALGRHISVLPVYWSTPSPGALMYSCTCHFRINVLTFLIEFFIILI